VTAIRGIGWAWQPENKEEKLANLATRLNLAIEEFRKRWGDVMPQFCFTSEELPDEMPDTAVPVYYNLNVTPYHLWLEFPEGFDFRMTGRKKARDDKEQN